MIQQIAPIEQEQEAQPDVVRQIALAQLIPSKTQPRTIFDPEEMRDLTESVRTHGIIQPLLVRPLVSADLDQFEIVAGERRHRAATAVGLETVPAIVRELSDQAVLEIQLIENLQRDDLKPMEEAQGYKRLLDLRVDAQPVYTVEKIAAAVGKPRQRIYLRLKLLRVPAPVRVALENESIGPDLAEMIGAIPAEKSREEAALEILHPTLKAGPMSRDEARAHIDKHYMRSLSAAPFDQKDETLVAIQRDEMGERIAGGACTDCPLRSGNMPEGNPKRPDICTNPLCYTAKCDAHWARLHTDGAQRLLTTEQAAAIFDEDDRIRLESDYVDLATQPDRGLVNEEVLKSGKIPTWKKLLAALPEEVGRPEVVVARDSRGRIRELVQQSALMMAVDFSAKQTKTKSIFDRSSRSTSTSRSTSGADDKAKAEKQRAEREEQRLQFEVKLAAMGALVAEMVRSGDTVPRAALIDLALLHAGHDGRWMVARRRGLEDDEESLRNYGYDLANAAQEWAFAFELLLGKAFKSLGLEDRAFQGFAKLYELDLKAIEKAVRSGEKIDSEARKPGKESLTSSEVESLAKAIRHDDHPGSPLESAVNTLTHKWEKIAGTKYRCAGCGAAAVKHEGKILVAREFRGKPCSGALLDDSLGETSPAALTVVEQKALELMKPGVWYDGVGLYAESLPHIVRRRAHVLECLKTKGAVRHEVRFSVPGNLHSTYSVYQKLQYQRESPSTNGKKSRRKPSKETRAMIAASVATARATLKAKAKR